MTHRTPVSWDTTDGAMSSSTVVNLPVLLCTSTVAEVILAYLTLADSVALHRVCRVIRGVIESERRSRLSINYLLREFVEDCDLFRYNLGSSDGLLIGGAILEFSERRHCTVPCLDILLEGGPRATSFVDYLGSEERYTDRDDRDVSRLLFTRAEVLMRDRSNRVPLFSAGRLQLIHRSVSPSRIHSQSTPFFVHLTRQRT